MIDQLFVDKIMGSPYRTFGTNLYFLPSLGPYGTLERIFLNLMTLRARLMSIRIIEVFVKLRKMLTDNSELRLAVEKLERKTESNTKNLEMVFRYVEQLIQKKRKEKPRKKIGYKIPTRKK